MIWLFCIIIAALAYAAMTVNDFKSFFQTIQPKIERLETEAVEFERSIRSKSAEIRETEEELAGIQEQITGLKHDTTSTEAALKEAKELETRLETEKYRQDFRSKS